MKNHLLAGLASVALSASALSTPSYAQSHLQPPAKPKLAVILVIDQFPADYLSLYAPFFGPNGFKRLQREGASLTNARYAHATTYTGPGHALIASGSYGHTSSITGNRWFNRTTGRMESMFFDANARLIGVEASPKDDDTSPRNFIGNMIGDQLRLSNGFRSKVIGLSNKDRAAIMLAGKLGRAYWFHEGAGGLTSSSYYGTELPAWVQTFNARKLPDSYFNKTWTKSLPESAYYLSRRDDFAGETDVKGLGRTFPHVLTDASGKPTTAFYEAFTTTPFATDFQFEAARAAIENEQLGLDEYTDLLGLSITATDIAGHAYGPGSQEIQDMIVRLDGQIAGFLSYLDKRFKRGEVTLVLTADHGASPLPEYTQSIGIEAGRVKSKSIIDAVESALTARFGAPNPDSKWVVAVEDPGIFLNRTLIAERKLDAAQVQRVAGEAALTVPGISAYFTREGFVSGAIAPSRYAAMYEKTFHADRSGDVLYQVKPFYISGSYGNREVGSTHGSPYEYDSHVPLIFWGSGIRADVHAEPVEIADLAPTLSTLIGVSPPAGSEGHALSAVLASTR
jgi:predicted AlkP superfamily pyrophosphatase or phosphodiesterase